MSEKSQQEIEIEPPKELEERLISDGIDIGLHFLWVDNLDIEDLLESKHYKNRLPEEFKEAREYYQKEINKKIKKHKQNYEEFQRLTKKYEHIPKVKPWIDHLSVIYNSQIELLQKLELLQTEDQNYI